MQYDTLTKAISIDQPMVIIPTEEYRLLLREAGLAHTPVLDREIAQARRRFKNRFAHLRPFSRKTFNRK